MSCARCHRQISPRVLGPGERAALGPGSCSPLSLACSTFPCTTEIPCRCFSILESEGEREKETLMCCSAHLCSHWLILRCALTGLDPQPWPSGMGSNRMNYPASQGLMLLPFSLHSFPSLPRPAHHSGHTIPPEPHSSPQPSGTAPPPP